MLPRVAICLMLVGCGETARPDAPATSSEAQKDNAENPPHAVSDRREYAYRDQVRAFLKQGFAVQGLGLSPDDLKLLRSEASCQLDPAGVVVACTTTKPSGNAKFDAAVTAALDAKKGKQTPPPPADQPGWRANQITMSLRCGPSCS